MTMTIWRMNAWEKLIPSVHQKRIGGRIANEILMYLRARKKRKSEVSIYEPIGIDKEGNELTLQDVLGTETDIVADEVEQFFERNRLFGKMDRLTKREQMVVILRYGLHGDRPQTQREIGKQLGISRSYV